MFYEHRINVGTFIFFDSIIVVIVTIISVNIFSGYSTDCPRSNGPQMFLNISDSREKLILCIENVNFSVMLEKFWAENWD